MKVFTVAENTEPERLARAIVAQLSDAVAVQLHAAGSSVMAALRGFSAITVEMLPKLRPVILDISYESVNGRNGPITLTKLTIVALPR